MRNRPEFDDPFLLHCSQTTLPNFPFNNCLMILFFYTALKRSFLCRWHSECLMILFFYTALKLWTVDSSELKCLMILFFYTALKPSAHLVFWVKVWWSFSFTLLSNDEAQEYTNAQFDDPFLLHCSQTIGCQVRHTQCLMILFFYTALKPDLKLLPEVRFDDPFLLHCSQTQEETFMANI